MSKKKCKAIMLVDDNDLDNLINRKMIEHYSISENVYVHTGARSAIEFLRNVENIDVASEVLPDIIILDIDMPFMDGFQFLEEFKKLSKLVRNTSKIIILTSSENLADFDQSKKYKSIHLFVKKPLSHKDIISINI